MTLIRLFPPKSCLWQMFFRCSCYTFMTYCVLSALWYNQYAEDSPFGAALQPAHAIVDGFQDTTIRIGNVVIEGVLNSRVSVFGQADPPPSVASNSTNSTLPSPPPPVAARDGLRRVLERINERLQKKWAA